MKTKILIFLVLSLFLGCTTHVLAQMTPQQQETAKKEISEVVNSILRSLDSMDIEGLFKSYSNESDFIIVTTAGVMEDYQKFKNEHANWFRSLSYLRVKTDKEEFRFLPGNFVICAWQGKFEMTNKTGMQLKINTFGVTYIFKKIDNQWKVIYQHASASQPVQTTQTN